MWYALSIADSREELLARKAEFLKLPTVERTEEIVSLLPVDHEIKRPIIERIQQRLASLPERPPLIPVDRPEKLGQVLGGSARRCWSRAAAATRRCGSSSSSAICCGACRSPNVTPQLSRFQQQMAGDLLSRLHMLEAIANPEPPQLTDLPASLVDRFVGQHGRHLLKIYGRGNIWDTEALGNFVQATSARSITQVTGNPLQALRSVAGNEAELPAGGHLFAAGDHRRADVRLSRAGSYCAASPRCRWAWACCRRSVCWACSTFRSTRPI